MPAGVQILFSACIFLNIIMYLNKNNIFCDMEKGKYNKEKTKIARQIKESDLISKCQKVACLGEKIFWKEYDYSTHIKYKYEDKSFLINYEDGCFAMGDGMEINVVYKGEEVFLAYDNSIKKDKYKDSLAIRIGNEYAGDWVGKYIPGSWEKEIDSLIENISEKEEKEFKENFKL